MIALLSTAAVDTVQAQGAESEPADRPDRSETTIEPVEIEKISHANSSLVLFDEHGRRYALSDGIYDNPDGAALYISQGRISRVVGCGAQPCDFTTHSTRIVERRLLFYAEISIVDGTYHHDNGSWFRIEGGELVLFQGSP